MRFGSLFSGVGGFDMALEAAGMTPAWQVEVEPQAASVLRYRWPLVDLHADVRNVGRSNLAPVDLICGGSPCQDLSVAGKRAGLAGERSGLFHEFMRIVDELAPRWVLLENVPGLLSSNGGRDMGTVLGVLGRLGYGWTYRCLDTQYFGPPQRRLRVFIVGRAGGFCPPEVLLEPEGLPWNPPPSREARKGPAPLLEVGARSKSGGREGCGIGDAGDPMFSLQASHQHGVAGTLESRSEAGGFPGTDGACAGHVVEHIPDFSPALKARDFKGPSSDGDGDGAALVAHTLRAAGADASEGGTGRGTPLVVGFHDPAGYAPTLAHSSNSHMGHHQPKVLSFNWQSGGDVRQDVRQDYSSSLHVGQTPAVLPFDTTQITSKLNRSHPKPGNFSHPLAAGAHPPAIVGVAIPRRLTPRECERLQGWPDDWTRWGRTLDGEVKEISDSARYRMAGNGVSAPVAEWIGRRIVESFELHDLPSLPVPVEATE